MTLAELGKLHGTDKVAHGYMDTYERFFAPWREKGGTVLEIGVLGGASLRVWSDFFDRSRIAGVDNDPECAKLAIPRTRVFIGDQADPAFLRSVGEWCAPLAVVIDDGSHRGPDMEASFDALWPFMAQGGVYAIEDLAACWYENYRPSGAPFIKRFVEHVNRRAIESYLYGVQSVWLQESLCIVTKGPPTDSLMGGANK